MALASRGLRDMDTGPERIDDPELLAQVRRQARRVYVKSAVAGLVLVGLALLLP